MIQSKGSSDMHPFSATLNYAFYLKGHSLGYSF